MKKRAAMAGAAVILAVILLVNSAQKPYRIEYSVVYSSENLTETYLTVIMNTLFSIDEKGFVKEVVESHVRLNGRRQNEYFVLELYRTRLHYKADWRYDTVLCDVNGDIVREMEYR